MTTDQWTIISAVAAVIGAVAAAVAAAVGIRQWRRDQPRLTTRAAFFEDPTGQWNVSITISNSGGQPCGVSFVHVDQAGVPRRSFPFDATGQAVTLGVGSSVTTEVRGGHLGMTTVQELRNLRFSIGDALGTIYAVNF